jgi:hypothetical protein
LIYDVPFLPDVNEMRAIMRTLIVIAVFGSVAETACALDLEFRLETSKATYFEGEPVLFRTIYGSTRGPVQMKQLEYAPRRGRFALDVRLSGEIDWATVEAGRKPFIVCSQPGTEGFGNPFALPGSLRAGEKFERIDMRVMKPGRFGAKAFLLNDDGSRHETNEVSFEVVPIEGKDAITGFLQGSRLWSLASIVVGGHYTDGWEGSSTGMRPYLKIEEFRELAPVIIQECTRSAFREFVMYAYIISRERARHILAEPMEDPEVEALALQFLAEYPDSWLRPKIQLILYRMYREQKNPQAAIEMGREMFSSELQPTELRAWKQGWERMEAEQAAQGKAGD